MHDNILSEAMENLKRGFVILADREEFIDWSTTYDDLLKNPSVVSVLDKDFSKYALFQCQVLLGNLRIENFVAFPIGSRKDVPPNYSSKIRLKGDGDHNYFAMKEKLQAFLHSPSYSFERSDQNFTCWDLDGISLELVYWYHTDYTPESGYALLQISNNRKYSEYRENDSYEKSISIDKILIFDKQYRIFDDYRKSLFVKHTPLNVNLKTRHQSAAWRDLKKDKIGFTSADVSLIFPKNIVEKLVIDNAVPAKGGGYAFLKAVLANGQEQNIFFSENTYEFDKKIKELTDVTGFTPDVHIFNDV